MKSTSIIRITVFVFLIVGIVTAVAYRKQFNFAALEGWFASAGVMAPLLFIGIYAISTVLFLPGAVLTIAGGVLFGPIWGTFYSLTGATIGAAVAFLIARYLASDLVSRKIGGTLKQLVEGVEAEGWRFVAFVRLVPLFPFNLLNYTLGLTRIRLPTPLYIQRYGQISSPRHPIPSSLPSLFPARFRRQPVQQCIFSCIHLRIITNLINKLSE